MVDTAIEDISEDTQIPEEEGPPIPKPRVQNDYDELTIKKQNSLEYLPLIGTSTMNPIFDLDGASHMTKDSAPERLKDFLKKVQILNEEFYKKTGKKLIINDALTKKGSSREKNTPNSRHFHGDAVDLGTHEYSAEEKDTLAYTALEVGFTGLGFGANILHVDDGPTRSWSYDNSRYGTKSVGEWKKIHKDFYFEPPVPKIRPDDSDNQASLPKYQFKNLVGEGDDLALVPLQIPFLGLFGKTEGDGESGFNVLDLAGAGARDRLETALKFEGILENANVDLSVIDTSLSVIDGIDETLKQFTFRDALTNESIKQKVISDPIVQLTPGAVEFLTSDNKEEQNEALVKLSNVLESKGIDTSSFKFLMSDDLPKLASSFFGNNSSEDSNVGFGLSMLEQIESLFAENKGLFTLLGSTAVISGLTSLLGGDMLSGFVAGAGAVATTRLMLGPEGYSELKNTINTAAAPAFNIIEDIFDTIDLSGIPLLDNIVRGSLEVGRDNPLAAIALASGNVGGGLGLLAGDLGVGAIDGRVNPDDLVENLSNIATDATSAFQLATRNNGRDRSILTPGDQNNSTLTGGTIGRPSQSNKVKEIFFPLGTSYTYDYGYNGSGVQALLT